MKIEEIKAVQILDSRGNPTIKAYAKIDGKWGDFSVPSGASTGEHEALELRDGGKDYNGLGIEKAIANILGPIEKAVVGKEADNQKEIDNILVELDGTENKSNLGANAILAVSGAVARANALAKNLPLYAYLRSLYENDGLYVAGKNDKSSYIMPDLFMNILNGGAHADNNVDIQETMIVPVAKTVADKTRIGTEVYHALKALIKSRNLSSGLGDEGGFAPDLESNTKAIELVVEAIQKAGYVPGKDVKIALDIAASEIFDPSKDNKYVLNSENIGLSPVQLVSLYKELITNYPIVSIEDGLSQDDWDEWKSMTERIGKQIQLVGDDLFVTNPERIAKGVGMKAANAVLIKMNQIGTITETFEAIRLAVKNKYKCMISHRSGETCDAFIADLAVATGAGEIKAGAPARGERTAKYNRLIEIEEELKK